MINKLLGVAVIAAVAYAVVPAQAAHHGGGMGCSGANLAKTESAVEAMADGEGKIAAQKEMAAAQDAMLNGKGSCSAHLGKAASAAMAK